jgi:eukaryotic-like serine/threonine-protein kinase
MLAAEVETRRSRPGSVSFGPFLYDRGNRLLHHGDQELALPPRVLAVLDLLVSKAGEIVPKQDLIESVWKDAFVTDTSLAEAVSVLRQALGDDPQAPTYVQTIHRRGYRFVAPVTVTVAAPPASVIAAPPLSTPGPDRVSPSIGRELVPWGVTALCALLAVTALWQYTHIPRSIPPVVRMPIDPVPGTVFDNRGPALALSPNGTVVAWAACDTVCRLYVRRLDQLESHALAGTEGAAAPFFSPDGRSVGFFADGALRRISLAGGMPVTITDGSQPYGAVWLPDGHIVFAASRFGGLLRVSERGGDAEPLTTPSADAGELGHSFPSLAPDGRSLLFTISTSPLTGAPGRIAIMPPGRPSAWQTIVESADTAVAVSPEFLAFSRATEIHAAPFDATRQRLGGGEQVVVTGVARGQYAIAPSGAMVHAASEPSAFPALEWSGGTARTALSSELAPLQDSSLSRDGSRLVGNIGTDVWIADLNRGATTRLTHGGTNVSPVWSADGKSVLFAASKGGPFEIWSRDAAGTVPSSLVHSAAAQHRHAFPSSTSSDGRLVACTESGGPTRADVFVIALADRKTIVSVQTPFDEINGMLSPDGRILAYQSDESGRWEVYVLRLSDGRRLSVSSGGGTDPLWTRAGSTLFYRAGDRLVRVAIDPESGTPGAATEMLPLGATTVAGVHADGRLLLQRPAFAPAKRGVLTLEWARELRGVLGPPAATLPR